MIERYRPKAPLPEITAALRPRPKPIERYRPRVASQERPGAPVPTFVCLWRQVLTHPPIRHRGAPVDAGLSITELIIAATFAALARGTRSNARHEAAFRTGETYLKQERPQASKGMQYRVGGVSYQFKLAGSNGYARGREAFDRSVDSEPFLVECSVRKLFRVAALARNGRSTGRLDAVLDRLTKPIAGLPPVLMRWKRTDNHLRLWVNAQWVPSSHFGRVPWPLPTKGATILALYLFLFGADQRGNKSIRTEVLYRRLGIPLSRPAHAARALDAALDSVNQHLAKLNQDDKLEEFELPTAFQIEPLKEGWYLRLLQVRQAKRKNARTTKRSRSSGEEADGDQIDERADVDFRPMTDEWAKEWGANIERKLRDGERDRERRSHNLPPLRVAVE
jgi:hypothetical protein